MNLDIKLHKLDLPDDLAFSDKIAIDCEFMGLNVERDRLCLVQISSGNNDAHVVQLDKESYNAPNLKRVLTDKSINKIFNFARVNIFDQFLFRRASDPQALPFPKRDHQSLRSVLLPGR